MSDASSVEATTDATATAGTATAGGVAAFVRTPPTWFAKGVAASTAVVLAGGLAALGVLDDGDAGGTPLAIRPVTPSAAVALPAPATVDLGATVAPVAFDSSSAVGTAVARLAAPAPRPTSPAAADGGRRWVTAAPSATPAGTGSVAASPAPAGGLAAPVPTAPPLAPAAPAGGGLPVPAPEVPGPGAGGLPVPELPVPSLPVPPLPVPPLPVPLPVGGDGAPTAPVPAAPRPTPTTTAPRPTTTTTAPRPTTTTTAPRPTAKVTGTVRDVADAIGGAVESTPAAPAGEAVSTVGGVIGGLG